MEDEAIDECGFEFDEARDECGSSTIQETNAALNLCRLPSWNYQEDEECLRIEAIEVEATGYNMQIVHELWLKQQQLLV